MKKNVLLFCMLATCLLGFACVSDQPGQPDPARTVLGPDVDGGAKRAAALTPGGYYSFAWNNDIATYSDFELISKRDGRATPIWTLSGQNAWITVPPTLWGPSPVGLAFDLDGSMYTVIGSYYFDAPDARSRFARVDAATGQVTYIGDPVAMNYCGPDIDSKGNFYVCGMDIPHLGYIHGTGRLYKVDKGTGAFTEIGPLNVQMAEWMDLAFDSHDQLYATTQNKLFKIDTATGDITGIIPILGVPGDPPPPPYTLMQEVMSIAFDENDVLYGTAMNVEWGTGHGSPVMRIDTTTGQATFLGFTEQVENHGGDIMPTQVRVAHRQGKGGYHCITISMNALPAHLAHGDYVPGTAGHDFDCP